MPFHQFHVHSSISFDEIVLLVSVTKSQLIYTPQVLPLQRFQMDTRVDESRTFNLKPVPQNDASNDNQRQLECDVSVSQRSHPMSAVVIRAVHEIKIRVRAQS